MKTSNLKLSFLTALAIIVSAFSLRATNLTWDSDTLTTGTQDGVGVWDNVTNTWWDGSANAVWNSGAPDSATFGANSGAAGIVTNTVPNTVGNITFNAAGSGTYSINGAAANTLTLSGSPTITANVDAALNLPLAGTSFTKEGAGQLSLKPSANNTYTGTTIVNNGRLALNSPGSTIVIPGDLTINSGATVTNTGTTDPIADTATVTVNAGGTYVDGGDTIGTLILNGGTELQVGTKLLYALSVDARSGSITEATGATGKLDGNLTKSTSGTVTDSARGSSAGTGGLTNTIVNAGNLILDYTQSSSKLLDTGTLTVNGGTLTFANGTHTETVGTVILAGGTITNASGTAKLSLPSGNYDVRNGAVYTVLLGAGGGGVGLTKTTPGTVVLAAVDTYTNITLISEGILQLGDGTISGTVNSSPITDNASLVLNPGGAATISTVISGSGSVTKIGSGTAALTPINSYQGSTTISNGILSVDSDATLGDGTGTLNLSGGTFATTASRSVTTAPVANPVNLVADSVIATTSTSSSVDLNFTNDSIGGSAGTLTFRNIGADGAADQFEPRFSGSFTFNRPIVIDNGSVGKTRLSSFNAAATTQIFNGIISGNGAFRRSIGTGTGGTTVFNATNTYSGDTAINAGTLLVNGAIGAGIVTITSGGVLGGNGTVNGPVSVQSGGILSAGASIGVLTISNTLTFAANSTNYAEINKSIPTNDLVRGISTVTYGGKLVVANLSGTLALNDTFKIFDATTYAGSFSATNLPAFDPGLAWDTTGLTNNGTIKVVTATVTSPILNVSQSGNTLTFSWTGAFKLQSQTNGLSVGLFTNWVDYPDLSNPVVVIIDPTSPSVFFRLSQ